MKRGAAQVRLRLLKQHRREQHQLEGRIQGGGTPGSSMLAGLLDIKQMKSQRQPLPAQSESSLLLFRRRTGAFDKGLHADPLHEEERDDGTVALVSCRTSGTAAEMEMWKITATTEIRAGA